MITHKEAEILTSSRQDAPLDPVVERELQAHLATCDACRAFAIATERLTAGIKAMPSIPANPRTRRDVMARVNRGRNPLAGLLGGIGGGFMSGPVLAAAATLVIIGLFGWFALDQLVFEDSNGDNNQIAAVPTEEPVDLTVASPTLVPPTETAVPTETAEPEPTATTPPTTEPEPTATTPPTTEPEPTATTPPTSEPEPTATTPPTSEPEPEPEPTATTPPTTEPVADDEGDPTDLTTLSLPEETEPPVEPTATTAPTVAPTAITAPTDVPTEIATEEPTEESVQVTSVEETTVATEVVTPEPTQEATEVASVEPTTEPTVVPEPTNPGIEPMEGMQVIESDGTGAADPTQLPDGTGSGPAESDTDAIEPTGEEIVTATTPESSVIEEDPGIDISGADDIGSSAIEPMDVDGMGGNATDTNETTISPDSESTVASEEPEQLMDGQSLAAASVPYTNIDGDPSGDLGLTPNGRLEFMQVVDGASRTTFDGFRVEPGESQPSVLNLCGDGFCEPSMEAPESETWQGDVPLGVVGDTTYFLRLHSDRTEVYAATSSGTALLDSQVLTELDPVSAPAAVYLNNGTLYAWLATGQWLEISGASVDIYSGSYGDPYNVRFAPMANVGPLIGYFSGGTLVVAPVAAPDSPILTLPADGIDFDLTGGGTRIAVIQGNSIVIYDMEGNQLQVFSGGDMQPGSVIWLNSGIVYVDRNTGALYQIPETAP